MEERRKGTIELEKKVDNLDTRMLSIELGQNLIIGNDLPHIREAIEEVAEKLEKYKEASEKKAKTYTGLTLTGLALIGILIALLACMITIGIFQ